MTTLEIKLKKYPLLKKNKAKQMLKEYRSKYNPELWADLYAAIGIESNPQMLLFVVEDCIELAKCALDEFEHIPTPAEVIGPPEE